MEGVTKAERDKAYFTALDGFIKELIADDYILPEEKYFIEAAAQQAFLSAPDVVSTIPISSLIAISEQVINKMKTVADKRIIYDYRKRDLLPTYFSNMMATPLVAALTNFVLRSVQQN